MGLNGPLFLYLLPAFLAMIIVEARIGRRQGYKLHNKEENAITLAIISLYQVLGLIPYSLAVSIWYWAWEARLFALPADKWWYFPVAFFATDFFYYWYHRASHEIRWLWATHAVHHSVEKLNILSSYRLGLTARISMGGIVFAPLVILGVHPSHIVVSLALNLFYQSWLHTTLIPKLGILEGIINTPSAHRVHHARNAHYLDRNYGGVLMIFDRLFGTYEPEHKEIPVEFGLVSPVKSSNPLSVAFHEWIRIWQDLRNYPISKWPGLLFGPPGWKPDNTKKTSAMLRGAFKADLKQ